VPRGIYTRDPKIPYSPYADIPGEEFERLQYINKKTKLDPSTGCWNWEGPFDQSSYGLAKIFRIHHRAHRLAYLLLVGEIPDGLVLDHLCRNHGCCNPKHLEPVTIHENCRRGLCFYTAVKIHGFKTHCPRGHAYSGDNLIIRTWKGRKSRSCRACVNYSGREKWRLKRERNSDGQNTSVCA
jgi:hypothetical protein